MTFQAEGERNYHIFYMLLAGCDKDPEVRKLTGLTEAVDYHYLDQSGVIVAEGFNDENEYDDMVRPLLF